MAIAEDLSGQDTLSATAIDDIIERNNAGPVTFGPMG